MKFFSNQKSVSAFTAAFAGLCVYYSTLLLDSTGQLASLLP
jgi:hypothetical protein